MQANNSLVIHVETLYFSRLGQEVAPPVTSSFMEGRAWPRLSDGVLLLSTCILTVASEVVLHAIREAVTWAAVLSMGEATTATTHPCPRGGRNSRISRPRSFRTSDLEAGILCSFTAAAVMRSFSLSSCFHISKRLHRY